MIIQRVRSDSGSREGKWVGLIIASILLFATIAIPFHQSGSGVQTVEAHQLLITDIEQENLAMIAELRLAHEEIRDLHAESQELSLDQNKNWPVIETLQADWIAPFVKDQSWKRKGEHEWQNVAPGLYVGFPTHLNAAQPILLDSRKAAADIWINVSASEQLKSQLIALEFEKSNLIRQGWKQVVMTANNDTHSH